MIFIIFAIFVPLKNSPKNNEDENDKGIQSSNASIEVHKVPEMKGKAPYCSLPSDGFHSEEIINLIPNSFSTGNVPLTRDNTIPAIISTIIVEARNNKLFVIFSLEQKNALILLYSCFINLYYLNN